MAFKASSKRLPSQLTELIDIAVFSFASLSGLRSSHKVRGDPVIDGVCSMFGRLVECSSAETRNIFKEVSPARLGGWNPGSEATKELSTLISSRLKQAKEKDNIREHEEPCAPEPMVHKKQRLMEESDTLLTRVHPQCWRCKNRCRFCKLRKKNIVPSLKTEVTSPFLDIIEEMAQEIHATNSSEDEAKSILSDSELEVGRRLIKQCLSETDLTDSDSIADEEQKQEHMETHIDDSDHSIDDDDDDDSPSNSSDA